MKRVAIFRADLLPVSETFISDQAAALCDWEPVLIGRREIAGGLQTRTIAREVVSETSSRLVRGLRLWLALPDARVVERLKSLQVDLVHAHFGVDAADIWPSVNAAGLPMLVTLHGYDVNIHREWWETGRAGLRMRGYPRRLLNMARAPGVHFVAVSKAIRTRAIAYGIPEEKISVAYTGVDTLRFTPGGLPLDKRPRRIVFVGRMVEKKSPLLMIRVLAEVRKQVPDVQLVMIGEGPLLPDARLLAAELGLDVAFLGAQLADEVLVQLHQARALCLPSVTAENGDAEGFGMVLLEAQACGLPVVTSARGGAEEGMREPETGYRCAEGAVDQLAGALVHLLRDDAAALRASAEAIRFVRENFDVRNCARALELLYTRFTSVTTHA